MDLEESNMNTDWAHVPNRKGWKLHRGLFCTPPADVPALPPNTASLEIRCSSGWLRGLTWLIIARQCYIQCRDLWSHAQSKCCHINYFAIDNSSEKEKRSYNSPELGRPPHLLPSSGGQSGNWLSPQGGLYKSGVSQPWTPGHPKNTSPSWPHTQERQQYNRNLDLWKTILCLPHAIQGWADTRMSELEGLQRKLTGTKREGTPRLWYYLAQCNILFPTN